MVDESVDITFLPPKPKGKQKEKEKKEKAAVKAAANAAKEATENGSGAAVPTAMIQ